MNKSDLRVGHVYMLRGGNIGILLEDTVVLERRGRRRKTAVTMVTPSRFHKTTFYVDEADVLYELDRSHIGMLATRYVDIEGRFPMEEVTDAAYLFADVLRLPPKYAEPLHVEYRGHGELTDIVVAGEVVSTAPSAAGVLLALEALSAWLGENDASD